VKLQISLGKKEIRYSIKRKKLGRDLPRKDTDTDVRLEDSASCELCGGKRVGSSASARRKEKSIGAKDGRGRVAKRKANFPLVGEEMVPSRRNTTEILKREKRGNPGKHLRQSFVLHLWKRKPYRGSRSPSRRERADNSSENKPFFCFKKEARREF